MAFVVYKAQPTQENTCSKFINDHDLEASLPTHYPPPLPSLPFENRGRVRYTENIVKKQKKTTMSTKNLEY